MIRASPELCIFCGIMLCARLHLHYHTCILKAQGRAGLEGRSTSAEASRAGQNREDQVCLSANDGDAAAVARTGGRRTKSQATQGGGQRLKNLTVMMMMFIGTEEEL